ncbi:jg26496 [Pararge aegeria aegeria]|uniref:Jg26496 protein n=1 Tax=Pararge aegeria aegeria TaxID=348720 RepID=A0A8S4RW38_9NEOP|nr:jg26496 [Pararge aegeria aegeria]
MYLRRPVLNLLVVRNRLFECFYARSVSKNNTSLIGDEKSQLKSWQEIPGPPTLPMVGQLLNYLPGGIFYKKKEEWPEIMYKNYGPIVRLGGTFGLPPMIFLYEPEAAFHIFRNENWTPVRPGFQSLEYFRKHYKKKKDDSLHETTGLMTEHGEEWRKFRTTVNQVMLQPKTIKLYSDTLIVVADDMIKRMRLKRNEKNMLEGKFDTEINLWALEAIGVVALGDRLNCFDPNLPKDSPVKKLIQVVRDVLTVSEKLDFQPSLWRYIATPTFKKAMKFYGDQMKLNEYFINKSIEKLKVKDKTNEQEGVLEKLLEIDHKIAVIMASEMLFAGVDTTANTIIGALYLLAKNPEKQNKLREENLLKQEKKPYLRACIKETIRLLPVIGGNFRQTTKEYNVMGYKIPKGMFVIVANQYMCLMEENFPQPTEFIPERWIVDKSDPLYYGNTHPFVYSPFGFGVRSCIGRRIAELEMETFLEKLIENFEIEWFGPPMKTRATSINYLIGPYNFIFKDVK